MNYTLEFIQNVIKVKLELTVAELKGLISNLSIVVAPWNREEVKVRPGNSSEFLESLTYKRASGSLVGYAEGKQTEKYRPTPKNPLYITDGGHRLRWFEEIFNDTAAVGSNTYNTLPLSVRAIVDSYKITIDVTVHKNGEDLENYAKEEYTKVNTTTSSLNNGEVLKASTDKNLEKLTEELDTVMKICRNPQKDSREKRRETITAMISGFANGSNNMTTKRDDILKIDLTEEKINKSLDCIETVKELENKLLEIYQDIPDAIKFIKSRRLDLALDGPFLAALADASSDEERADINKTYLKFFKATLSKARNIPEPEDVPLAENATAAERKTHVANLKKAKLEHKKEMDKISKEAKAQWDSNMKRISNPGPGNSARSYNKRRYEYGWSQVKAIAATYNTN